MFLLGVNILSIVILKVSFSILAISLVKYSHGSSRHGLVFASISFTYPRQSIIKSKPSISKVNFLSFLVSFFLDAFSDTFTWYLIWFIIVSMLKKALEAFKAFYEIINIYYIHPNLWIAIYSPLRIYHSFYPTSGLHYWWDGQIYF